MSRPRVLFGSAPAVGLAVGLAWVAFFGHRAGPTAIAYAEDGSAAAAPFTPIPDSDIPKGEFGDTVRLGETIFREPGTYARQFVGNTLRCSNCHLDAGRLAGAAPLWAAYVAYPAFRSKNGRVISFEERLQDCFIYSMNGRAPKLGDPVLVALETYAYFLAHGAPTGAAMPGRGFPAVPKPPLPASYAHGAEVYANACAACHGGDGAGQASDGTVAVPPLWGPRSYNWGAGMGSVKNATGFIWANMPLGAGRSLSPQDAWDVATYIDSQIRPQDPRFTGDVAATRARFHDNAFSMYGRTVNGAVLGDPARTPPAGTVPTADAPEAAQP